jgi:hypothetical protein
MAYGCSSNDDGMGVFGAMADRPRSAGPCLNCGI